MPHPSEHEAAGRPLAADEAYELAETLKALASPARLRLLSELLAGEKPVERCAGKPIEFETLDGAITGIAFPEDIAPRRARMRNRR